MEKELEIKDTLEVNQISLEELEKAINSNDKEALVHIAETINDIDIAEVAKELSPSLLIRFFRAIPSVNAASIFSELSSEAKENLIKAMSDKELVHLINESYADDLTDTIGDMPANIAIRIIRSAPKEIRDDINKLLKFKKDSAGAIMTTEFLEFNESTTVERAIEIIRQKGRDAETVYTLFLKDKSRHFVGTVDLDDLIFAKGDEKLFDIKNQDAPYVYTSTDKEEVAKAFRRYDLNAIAVLNDDNCLSGIVTVDDAVDVIDEENSEDVQALHGVASLDDTYLETHPFIMAKKCIPWIIMLLVLGTFSSLVLSSFQEALALVPVLAAFIPTIMDTGGNAGGQTIALVIRGLALGEFKLGDMKKLLFKELCSSLIIASAVAIFSFIWFSLEQYLGIVSNAGENIFNGECWNVDFLLTTLTFSAVTSLTMFIAIISSKLIAVLLPCLAVKIKKDPAIVSQPLLTTIVDVTSLIIFFVLAELLIIPFIA